MKKVRRIRAMWRLKHFPITKSLSILKAGGAVNLVRQEMTRVKK